MDKKIVRAKIDLMLTQPFWGSMVTRLELRDWDGDTFATNGKYLYCPDPKHYNKSWTFGNLLFILAHETFHCGGGHIFRMKDKHQMLWNVAADFATNALLKNNGFEMPSDALYDKRFEGMTAEKIYNILMQEASTQTCPQDLQEPGKGQKDKDEKGKGKKGDKGDGDEESDAPCDPKEMEQDWKEAVTSAARQAKGRGHMPDGLEEYIDEILFPKVPWQTLLYKYLQASYGTTDYSAYPFNRRHIWREIYLPSMRGEKIEIVCAMDTSGSISKEDMIRYLSEIRGICSIFGSYTIHFFQADTEIHKYDIIEDESDTPTLVVGRGGTSFRAVFKRVEETEELCELPVVYFTDLDGDMPDHHIGDGVFWLIRKEQNRYNHKVPFGQIVEIDD